MSCVGDRLRVETDPISGESCKVRKIILIAILMVATVASGCQQGRSAFSALSGSSGPVESTKPPPGTSYHGDEYGRHCLPEEDGHLSRYSCEYRN